MTDPPPTESPADPRKETAELDRQLFALESLLKAGEVLQGKFDVGELSDLLLSMVRERAATPGLALLLLDEDTATFHLQTSTVAGVDPALQFPADRGILWSRLRAGQPFSVVDLDGEHRFPEFFAAHGLGALQSELWLPLVMPDHVVGVVTLGRRHDDSPVPKAEHEFLGRLVKTGAVSLNTALLYRSIETAKRDLKGSLHKLSLLFDITRALSAVSDLTELLQIILERALEAAGAERGSVMLLDESTGSLVVKVVFGLPDADLEKRINEGLVECQRFRPGEGIAGRVLQTSRALRVDNTDENRSFRRGTSAHVRSLICVPLNVEEETIGVINISNKHEGVPFSNEDEEILGALADQAAVAIARARLYEAAITDGLTGLHVRRFTLHRLAQEVKRARRYGPPLSLILGDIDHFKNVNDTWGHLAGDRVLEVVSDRIRGQVRLDVDIAGRYGGEEFLIVVPQTDIEGARECAERLRVALEASSVETGKGEPLRVTMSFGIAQLQGDETGKDLLARADSALYRAKGSGRNCVVAAEDPT